LILLNSNSGWSYRGEWDQQGISWKLPAGWKKMDVKKETFNYDTPDNAALLVNISLMNDDFPMDSKPDGILRPGSSTNETG